MNKKYALWALAFVAACVVVPKPLPPNPQPAPAVKLAFDLVACKEAPVDNYCNGPANAEFKLHIKAQEPDAYLTVVSDANGYAYLPTFPDIPNSDVRITADGFEVYGPEGVTPRELVATNDAGRHNFFVLKSKHVDPSVIPLPELAAIRGAMWPLTDGACGNLSLGPRPGQATNVIATVFITDYSPAEQDCIIGELKRRGYTHVVIGPLVDSDGYHGTWKPNDWRGANFERFLDALQKFWDNGLAPVVFGKPDNWTLDQFKNEFTGLLSQPRARRLIRLFNPMGWEAGAAYEYSSCTWAEAGRWARQLFPDAVIGLHMVSDRDAPAGTDALCNDDDHTWNPGGNAAAWGRVVPFYHVWYAQFGAFDDPTKTGCDREHPELTNFDCFKNSFNPNWRGSYRDRFEHGYAGWPRGSAWGGDKAVRVVYGEGSAYWRFWGDRSEAEGVAWGDASIASGAYGYLDGGSVPVSVVR